MLRSLSLSLSHSIQIELGQFSHYAEHQSVFKSPWQILIYVSQEQQQEVEGRIELNHALWLRIRITFCS